MSERQFTEGPWRADCNTQDGGYHVEATINGGKTLVICSRAPWPSRRETSLANAALIAAAPDLLEALQEALVNLGCTFRDAGKRREAAAQKARAAIGESR